MTLYLLRNSPNDFYCGPTALCAVTGLLPKHVLHEIALYRRSWEPVVGMHLYEIRDILIRLQFKVRCSFGNKGVTIAEYCERLRQRNKFGKRIVGLYRHVLATDGRYVFDTYADEPVLVENYKLKNHHVDGYIIVN